MDSFIPALQSTGHAIKITVVTFGRNNATWGFLTGAAAMTGIFSILLAEHPSHLPIILTKTPDDSFNQLAIRAKDGNLLSSFVSFKKRYYRIRLVSSLLILLFFLIVLVALLRY